MHQSDPEVPLAHALADPVATTAEAASRAADAMSWFMQGTPNPDEAEQQASEGLLFWSIMDAVADAVLVTQAEPFAAPGPRIVYANRSFLEHTGYRLDEVLGRDPRFLQGPDTERAPLDRIRAALEAWQPVSVELRNYKKDGTPFWVEIAIAPVADASGWFTHWVSVQRDTTERHERVEAERKQRDFLDSVLASLPSQTAVLDPSGDILAVNTAWEDFWVANDGAPAGTWGSNYLRVCDLAAVAGDCGAADCVEGIRAVIERRTDNFSFDYECSSPTEERWFHLNVVPLLGLGDDESPRRHVIVSHHDITARKQLERALWNQARVDPLTRLPNRFAFLERLESLCRVTRQSFDPADPQLRCVTVITVDVDDFQTANDSLGHDAGDRLLQSVARELTHVVGPRGVVARYGGDEFAIAVATDEPGARELGRLVQAAVRLPFTDAAITLSMTATIGIAVREVTCTEPAEELALALVRMAATALHRAKDHGPQGVEIFAPEMGVRAVTQLRLLSSLRRALSVGDLRLAYQPITSLDTGRVIHREALLRWEHEGELLTPDVFLPLAEHAGMMGEIGAWVISRACRDAARWRRRGEHIAVAVNLAAEQLQPGLPAQVARAANSAGLPLTELIVEVTETQVLSDLESAAAVLARLREMGVRVHVDDFGTGYSSLVYLAALPVDGLKLDREFVAALPKEQAVTIVRAVAHLAHGLGLELVAEGVETEEQAKLLQGFGYMLGQGWLYGRPQLPAAMPRPPVDRAPVPPRVPATSPLGELSA